MEPQGKKVDSKALMAAAHLRGYFLVYVHHLLEKVTKHFKMLNVKDSITIVPHF